MCTLYSIIYRLIQIHQIHYSDLLNGMVHLTVDTFVEKSEYILPLFFNFRISDCQIVVVYSSGFHRKKLKSYQTNVTKYKLSTDYFSLVL